MCDLSNGVYRIKPDYPMIVRFPIDLDPAIFEQLHSAIDRYLQTLLKADAQAVLSRYYFGDFARKVVGVGSVGTEAFVLLRETGTTSRCSCS